MEYYYKIYGLRVKSEMEFPEAYQGKDTEFDVEIRLGRMPDFIQEKKKQGFLTSVLLREYRWFYFKGEGSFLIKKGRTITIERDSNSDEMHIRALVLGACFGCLLYQRDIPALHGAAVAYHNQAIIICGDSGSGKSTISTEFRKRGCLFLADDMVAVSMEDEKPYAESAFPQQKLCKDAALEFGYQLTDLLLLEEEREKYAVFLDKEFCNSKKRLAMIVHLDTLEDGELLVEEKMDSDKLLVIIKNLYSKSDFAEAGMHPKVFRQCLFMAQTIPLITVKRPKDKKFAEEIVDQIISIIENKKWNMEEDRWEAQ